MSNSSDINVPVLIIAFKRYEATAQLIDVLREARIPRVYFACDGGRDEQEWRQVQKVRSLVEKFDWGCQLETRFNTENKGCRINPSESITWFFENEVEGIITEDDVLPDITFFSFCQELLDRYRDDSRVWAINGHNWASNWETDNKNSYYFSSHGYGAYWGWATWRRSWSKFDLDIPQWPELKESGLLESYFLSSDEARYAKHFFDLVYNKFDTWDYQFDLAKIMNNGVNIIPSKSLTRNTGFGHDATHTFNEKEIRYGGGLFQADFPLIHPEFMLEDKARELYCFRRFIKPSLFRRIKNMVKAMLPERVDRLITQKLSVVQRRLGL